MNKSRVYQLSDDEFWYKIEKGFNEKGGIYKLFAKNDNSETIAVARIVKSDVNGILYIGKAQSFLNRVIALKKSIAPNYNSNSHECGVRHKNSVVLNKKYPYKNLFIELTEYEADTIGEVEKLLLTEYETKFGELPPLNRNK